MSSVRLFIVEDTSYSERKIKSKQYKRKIYLAFEGSVDESAYFKSIKEHLKSISKSVIDIIPLDRNKDDGKSHPIHVRDGLAEYYEFNKEEFDCEDSLWIIIDIDRHFGDEEVGKIRYQEFLESLKTKIDREIFAAISNPSFELWLVLHHDKVENLDLAAIKENKKVSTQKTYIKGILANYEQKNGKGVYTKELDVALERTQHELLETKIEKIYRNIGTYIFKLIEDILK